MEDTPKHLPPGEGMFEPWDIIYGPMEAVPAGTNKFDVPKYEEAKVAFEAVKKMDRQKLYISF